MYVRYVHIRMIEMRLSQAGTDDGEARGRGVILAMSLNWIITCHTWYAYVPVPVDMVGISMVYQVYPYLRSAPTSSLYENPEKIRGECVEPSYVSGFIRWSHSLFEAGRRRVRERRVVWRLSPSFLLVNAYALSSTSAPLHHLTVPTGRKE
jgi:hypothetical protein